MNITLKTDGPRNAYPWERWWYKVPLFEFIQKVIESDKISHSKLTPCSKRAWYHLSIHRLERYTSSFDEIGVQLNIGKHMWTFRPKQVVK